MTQLRTALPSLRDMHDYLDAEGISALRRRGFMGSDEEAKKILDAIEVAPEPVLKVGDIVTRTGNDLQRVVATNATEENPEPDLIEVECIKEPLGWLNDDGTREEPWCKLGDREWNLPRRYSHPEEA